MASSVNNYLETRSKVNGDEAGGKAFRLTYGVHQGKLYAAGMFENSLPAITTDPNKLEQQVKEYMNKGPFGFIAGACGERATLKANRLAFRQWRLIPRHLGNNLQRDLSVTLFGQTYPTPILLAPIGVQKVYHSDGEVGMAETARDLDIPYIMSTAATTTIEDVAKASGDSHRWFQLYWPRSDAITVSLLRRAKQSGFSTLVVTLDTTTLAWRPYDLDNGFLPFLKGSGSEVGAFDPVFQRIFAEKHGKTVEEDPMLALREWQLDAMSCQAHTWEDLKLLRDNWDGPIVLKGIQHVEDAKLAVAAGVQGVVVSNHGGRQPDGAIGSLEVLPEIVDAVGGKLTVLFDSGVRTGADILEALSLGAKGVLLARPWVYGLGIGGKEGAKAVIQGILADLELSMCMSGVASVAVCQRANVRKVVYGGDVPGCD